MISEPEARAALEQAGVSPTEVDALTHDYGEAQLEALKTSLLGRSHSWGAECGCSTVSRARG